MLHTFKAALLGASVLGACATLGAQGAGAVPMKLVGVPAASSSVHFDVVLPLRNRAGLEDLLVKLHDPASPLYHHWLTPTEFGLRFGPDSATVARVVGALQARGFTVKTNTRSLHVTGPAQLVEAAFGTKLALAPAEAGHTHVVTTRDMRLPAELADAGAQIFSFSPHVKHTMSRLVGEIPDGVDNRYSATGAYWFDDYHQAYSYPSNLATVTTPSGTAPLNGTGVTIAALMSSDVYDSDIQAMFDHENWSTVSGTPDPKLAAHIAIDGGGGLGGGAFPEASIDTQSELGSAPGAHVVLYNIPSLSDGDIFNGYVTIVEQNAVDIVSSSFGECEQYYLPAYNGGTDQVGVLRAYHEIFLQGNAQGITFMASSGDESGRECYSLSYFEGMKGIAKAGVSTPAVDPNVTAVGGGNLITTSDQDTLDSTYVGENAWEDPFIPGDPYGTGGKLYNWIWGAGGGYSVVWPQPSYQALVNTGSTKWRSLPDIGAQVGGCPSGAVYSTTPPTGCNGGNTAINGNGDNQRSAGVFPLTFKKKQKLYGFIGTSLSSPQMAGIAAMIVQQNGRMGNLNTYIYKLAAAQAAQPSLNYFRTGIPGYNGVVNTNLNSAYSLSYGVGSPIVNNFVGASSAPVAGTPQTPSNP